MPPKPPPESCPVCGGTIPLPEPEQVLVGGRPRQYCGGRCRYRSGRRQRTVRKLRWWAELAQGRGNETLAQRFQATAERIAAAAWNHSLTRDARRPEVVPATPRTDLEPPPLEP